MKHTYTYWSPPCLAAPPPIERTSKSRQKNFWRRLYKFVCLKLHGHWTESHQISIICTEMIAAYSAEIKIAIFQSVLERKRDEWRSSSNCGRITAKIVHFNSLNSEIIGQKFTKFGHDVACLMPFNILKADLRLATPKQRAKVVPHDICDHLPDLTGCHSKVPWATAKRI